MVLLLAMAGILTAAVVGVTVVVTVVVIRDRTRHQRRAATPATGSEVREHTELPESIDDTASDFVQFWMDNEWDQRFG